MSDNSVLISINGKIVAPKRAAISVLDSGVLSGFGVFETVLSVGEHLFRFESHLRRLEDSRRAIGLTQRFSLSEIEEYARKALAKFLGKSASEQCYSRMRITLTGGNTGEGLWGDEELEGSLIIIVQEHSLRAKAVRPVAEIISSATPEHWLARHKTLSRMLHSHPVERKRGTRATKSKRLQIMHNLAVGVAEFTTASLFVRHGVRVITAPTDTVFPGICRAEIIQNWGAVAPEFELETRRIELADILRADEVIGVNSLRGAFALSQLYYVSSSSASDSKPLRFSKPILCTKLRDFLLTC